MIHVSHPNDIPEDLKPCILTIGKFDGVHLGHQSIIAKTLELASKQGFKTVAATFDPPPVQILRPDLPVRPPITSIDRKVELLRYFGISEVVVFQTGHWLLDLSAKAFFDEIVVSGFDARGLVEGPNFTFGKNRTAGTVELRNWTEQKNLDFLEVSPVGFEGHWITSSRIVTSILQGEIAQANSMLGHHHVTAGTVVRGAGRGRSINVPTANLEHCDTLIPGPGVYAASARVLSGSGQNETDFLPAAVNIGTQPTFGSDSKTLEVHLVGHPDQDLYGQTVEIIWLEKIRETVKFDSVERLISQIREDIQKAVTISLSGVKS